jgi:hypothetical protein
MATSERLKLLLQSAVDDWDIHIEVCPECLIARMHLCVEGRIITGRVDTIREKLDELQPGRSVDGPADPTSVHLPAQLTSPIARTP